MRHSCSCAQGTGSPCRVEYLVVLRPQEFSSAHSSFIPGDRTGYELPPRRSHLLSGGKHRGKHGSTWMKPSSIVHIIQLGYMRSCTIHKRSKERRRASARCKNLARALRGTHSSGKLFQYTDRRRVSSCEG